MSSSPRSIPRVAAIHDLSGFGRCALAAVIPAYIYFWVLFA